MGDMGHSKDVDAVYDKSMQHATMSEVVVLFQRLTMLNT